MHTAHSLPCRSRIGLGILLAGLLAAPTLAEVEVSIDRQSLNRLLNAVTQQEIEFPLGDQSLRVVLEDIEVLGFHPGNGEGVRGTLSTSVSLRVPQFGIALKSNPKLTVGVAEQDGDALLEFRFREVPLALPLTTLDLAPFLPPLRYPTHHVFGLAGQRGDVAVQTHVTEVRIEAEQLRFTLALDVLETAGTQR